ncbi:hypothetical protein [Marinicella meishanensis]|uniref:hypothetical protein n=1 Tax=Marinicella meishanensis TaxID=2873263 RepID=UPI001CC1BE70|nr:hypothetical protein [Marinicella sp. NBU2979]
MKFDHMVGLLLGFAASTEVVEYPYAVGPQQPHGQLNPAAPKQLADFQPMIGSASCESVVRVDQQTWAEPVAMTWVFQYIMNGMAVQDITLKADGGHSGSIRQYDVANEQWNIHYFSTSTPTPQLPVWTGGKAGERLVFWREQAAPNGMSGHYRLTFYDMTASGYRWIGEWVSEDLSITYPTWKINCKKVIDVANHSSP